MKLSGTTQLYFESVEESLDMLLLLIGLKWRLS
jgi:hypothetical protein